MVGDNEKEENDMNNASQATVPAPTRDGELAVEWTWDGNDEMDRAQSRGWAVVKGDELHEMIFFPDDDDSEVVAKKTARKW
jgi:hypothetical protein